MYELRNYFTVKSHINTYFINSFLLLTNLSFYITKESVAETYNWTTRAATFFLKEKKCSKLHVHKKLVVKTNGYFHPIKIYIILCKSTMSILCRVKVSLKNNSETRGHVIRIPLRISFHGFSTLCISP